MALALVHTKRPNAMWHCRNSSHFGKAEFNDGFSCVYTNRTKINAFNERDGDGKPVSTASAWYARWFNVIKHVYAIRCADDGTESSAYTSLLAVYVEHGILALGAQAIQEFGAPNANATAIADSEQTSLRSVYTTTAQTAIGMIDMFISDTNLCELRIGFPNSYFIMICHAVAELSQVSRLLNLSHLHRLRLFIQSLRGNVLAEHTASEVASKVRALTEDLKGVVKQLPTLSASRQYVSLLQSLTQRIENFIRIKASQQGPVESFDSSLANEAWLVGMADDNYFGFPDIFGPDWPLPGPVW